MSQSLQQMVSSVGTHVAKNIVHAQILYPRSDKLLLDNRMLELDFDGTLHKVIIIVENIKNLTAIDAVKDSIVLLKMMEEFQGSPLLNQAKGDVCVQAKKCEVPQKWSRTIH
jgi:hypothetical protein